MRKIYSENTNQMKAGVAILIPNVIDFRARNITRNKQRDMYNDTEFDL